MYVCNVCMHKYITYILHTYMHTCIHTYIHTCMHATYITYIHYIHTLHTYIHTYMHAYIHTCMHACIHTYIHTYVCVCCNAPLSPPLFLLPLSQALYENGLHSLVELTSVSIELFRKMAEISLLPDVSKTAGLSVREIWRLTVEIIYFRSRR